MGEFKHLLDAATLWGEMHAQTILKSGGTLSAEGLDMARRVGVKRPELIRLLVVPSIPFPDDPALLELGDVAKLRQQDSAGLTIGYGIYIRSDHAGSRRLIFHEMRHVAQYECVGSIRNFMLFYLLELQHFGYSAGPLEIDAIKAEELAMQ